MSGLNNTFSTNVPQSSQKISSTQTPIKNNFAAISEIINVNHIGFSDPNDYGKHTFTSLPFQSSNPSTSSTEMAVFSVATPSGPNAAEIFYRYPSDGSVVQLTGGVGTSISATSGFAYMSTTVAMIWGLKTGIVSSSTNTIIFPTGAGFPILTAAPQIYYTAASNYTNINASTYISSSSSTQFVLTTPQANYATSIYWMAIGAF